MRTPIIARDNLLFLKKPLRSRDLLTKISPDGKCLAGISRDPDVLEVWDTACGRRVIRHPKQIDEVSFSPNGRYLAVSEKNDSKNRILVWDLQPSNWRNRMKFLIGFPVRKAGKADAHEKIAVSDGGGVYVARTDTDCKNFGEAIFAGPSDKIVQPSNPPIEARHITFWNHSLLNWNSKSVTLQPLDSSHYTFRYYFRVKDPKHLPHTAAVSPDGKRLAIGWRGTEGALGQVSVFEIKDSVKIKPVHVVRFENTRSPLYPLISFWGEENLLALGNNRDLTVYNQDGRSVQFSWPLDGGWLTSLEGDASRLLVAGYKILPDWDNPEVIWQSVQIFVK